MHCYIANVLFKYELLPHHVHDAITYYLLSIIVLLMGLLLPPMLTFCSTTSTPSTPRNMGPLLPLTPAQRPLTSCSPTSTPRSSPRSSSTTGSTSRSAGLLLPPTPTRTPRALTRLPSSRPLTRALSRSTWPPYSTLAAN